MGNDEPVSEPVVPEIDPEGDKKQFDAHRLSTVGWALFFIWVGIAFLLEVSIGVGMLGVGLITLAMQVVRKSRGLKLEVFWIVIGALFALGGLASILESTKSSLPLIPIMLILAGVLLLLTSGRRRK